MKKKLGIIFLSALVIAMFAIPAFALTGGISGSAHDFAADRGIVGSAGEEYDVLTGADISCLGCHVPHNANDVDGALFSEYFNTTSGGTDAGLDSANYYSVAEFTPVTKLCMSCHDGTMTVPQTAGTRTEDTRTNPQSSVAFTDNGIAGSGDNWLMDDSGNGLLADDHPVGIEYNEHRFRTTTGAPYSSSVRIATLNDNNDDAYAVFAEGQVYVNPYNPAEGTTTSDKVITCYSCHDPHMDLDGREGDEDSFLRVKPQQAYDVNGNIAPADLESAAENLCIQCHEK